MHCSFDSNKNKNEDLLKKFSKDLKEQATKIINCEKREMLPLIKNEEKKYKKQKFCQICKEKFNGMFNEDENYCRVCDHCHYSKKHRDATHSISNLRYKTP